LGIRGGARGDDPRESDEQRAHPSELHAGERALQWGSPIRAPARYARALVRALWKSASMLALAGCAAVPQRFPLADPIWRDEDMRPFAERPAEIYTPPQWDRVDHTLFRP